PHMRRPRNVWDSRHWRWIGSKSSTGRNGAIASLVNPVRATAFPKYDVYLRLYQGVELNAAVRARLRLLVPSGNRVEAGEARGHHFVALQAPDNAALLAAGVASTLLPPPLYPLSAD